MSTENKMMPENARLAAVLADPDMILKFKTPSEKAQMAAVQRKPELIGHPLCGCLADEAKAYRHKEKCSFHVPNF